MASLFGDPSSAAKAFATGANAGADIARRNLYNLQLQQEQQKIAEQGQVRRAQDLYEMAGRTGNPSDYQQALSDNAIPASVGMQVQEADPRTKATKDWLANAASMAMVADNNEYEPTMRALYRAGKAQGVDFSQFGINSEDEMAKVPRSSVAIATGMVSHDTIKEIVKQKSKLLTENQDVMSTPQLYVNPQNGRQEMWYFRKSGEPARFIRTATAQDLRGPDSANERELVKNTIKELPKLKEEAIKQSRNISTIDQALGLLKTGNVTGKGGQVRAFLQPYAEAMGINTQNMDNAQTFQLLTRVITGPMRLDLIGSGPVTEYEQKLLKDMSGGGSTGQAAAYELLTYYKSIAKDKIGNYNQTLSGALELDSNIGKIHKPISIDGQGDSSSSSAGPKKVGRFIVEVEGK